MVGIQEYLIMFSFPDSARGFLLTPAYHRSVGLSMMCYTLGKAERTCRGERQARGLIGNLLY